MTRKVVGIIEGLEIVLSIVKINEEWKEMAFVIGGEWNENFTFRYRSPDGGKQIAFHMVHLLQKCSTIEEWEELIWSDEWTPRWIMWSTM